MIIQNLKVQNFKGMIYQEMEFGELQNIIEGENGVGKTTILDSITWVLFGKNFKDEKQFKIKPIIDGKEEIDLETKVVMNITVNNEELKIERSWHKDKTEIKINDTKMKNNEFNDLIEEKLGITINEFKMLTNIDYIPKLHWKELRKFITDLIGDITNEEMLATNKYDEIRDKINMVGVDITARDIKESKGSLKKAIDKIDGNIEEKTKDIENLVVNDNEVEELENRKEQLQKELEQVNEYETLTNSKLNLEVKLELKNKELDGLDSKFEIQKEDAIARMNNNIDDCKDKISMKKDIIETATNDREKVKEKYNKLAAKEIKVEEDSCPSCGQSLPKEEITKALDKSKQIKIDEINDIRAEGKRLLLIIETKNDEIKLIETDIVKFESDIEVAKAMEAKTDNGKKDSLNLEIQELRESLKLVYDKLKSISETKIDRREHQFEIDKITEKLATSVVLEKFSDQLNKLKLERKDMIQKKEDLNAKEQKLIQFNNDKAELMRKKAKNHFEIADFITQEETKDGSLVETFKLAVDNVPYDALNNGKKIEVALDLIYGIQKLKKKILPILIDGLGELTRMPFLKTQVIGCKAKYQNDKKIEIVRKEA